MVEPLICLCNPPSPPNQTADREAAYGMGALRNRGSQAQPPHTLAWCAALLQQAGWCVDGLDAVAEAMSEAHTLAWLAARAPDLLVLLVSPQTAVGDHEFILALRRLLPDVPLLLVSLASAYLPSALVRSADMVLVGEPEGAIHAACRFLLAQDGPVGAVTPHAMGVSGYDQRGHLLDMSYLPPPAWELFSVRRYDCLPVVASRGCAMGCRYCPAPVTLGATTRTRIAERVAAEIHLLHSRHGIREFYFLDPLFAADRAHTLVLCRSLIARELPGRVRWHCETRPDQLDLGLLQRMATAGCRTLHLGLESVSPETLIGAGRLPDAKAVHAYLTHVREVVLGCRAFDIDCHLHVLAGMPGDRAGAAATRAFLRAYPPDALHVAPMIPYPGTSIFPTNLIDEDMVRLDGTMRGDMGPPDKGAGWWRALGGADRLPST